MLDIKYESAGSFADDPESGSTFLSQFVQMNVALVLVGGILAFVSEHTHDSSYRTLASVLSLVCCIVAISLTHGLGGHMRHKEKGWRFSQTCRGGTKFVALQIVAWSFFGAALLLIGGSIAGGMLLGRQLIEGSMYLGGVAMLISEAVHYHFALVLYCGPPGRCLQEAAPASPRRGARGGCGSPQAGGARHCRRGGRRIGSADGHRSQHLPATA